MSGVQVPPPLFLKSMKLTYPQFKDRIKTNSLIDDKDIIIIALSGGKDSIALTVLLNELQKDIKFTLYAAYFNHKIREDYKEEESWVKAFCKQKKIKLYTSSAYVKDYIKEKKLNLENGASILRYKFFHSLLEKHKNSKVFTAHTKSDATETFFIKLFRGSGLQGLSSISMTKNNQFYRPLLYFTKEQVLDFLKNNAIEFYTDKSNAENIFLRNRIRNVLIPQIKEIEPSIDNSISKTIQIVTDEYNYFSSYAKSFLNNALILNKIIPISSLTNLHIAIQKHILREYIRLMKGNIFNISYENIEELLYAIKTKKNISLPAIDLCIKNDFIYPADFSIQPYKYQINKIDTSVIINKIQKKLIITQLKDYIKPENNYEIIIQKKKCKYPLILRTAIKNDKYIKINSNINMSAFEMIRSQGIPVQLRNLCPVLTNSDNEIIWVFGAPIANKFKITNKNDKNIFLKIKLTS